jgi:hypothetical protein
MSTKFIKYFTKSLLNEATPLAPVADSLGVDDSSAFAGSFEDGANAEKVAGEVDSLAIDPVQKDKILKLADKYAENISAVVLPTLRRLHDDIVSGTFSSIAPDIKGISGINEDLAKLAESLRGRTREAILKNNKTKE